MFGRSSCVLAVLVVAGSAGAQSAATPRPFTADDVLGVRQVADAQISPDGKWVAYVVNSADLKENAYDADIWLVATTGGPPIRITTSKKNDNQPRWSPDGKKLAFISARGERPQLFLISPFGGEAEPLSESKTGVTSFQWSPDGRRIAFVAQRDLTADEERRQKEKDDAIVVDKDFRLSRVSTIDVATRRAVEVVSGEYQVADPQWSPDGKRLAYVSTPTPKADDGGLSDVWVVDVPAAPAAGDSAASANPAAPRARRLVENEGADNAPRWSPDGQRIAFLTLQGKAGGLGLPRLAVIPVEGGAPRVIAPTFDYPASAPTWSADGRTLYFTAPVRTGAQLFAADVAGGTVRQLSDVKAMMSGATISRDGQMAAVTLSDVQNPNDVHVVPLRGAWKPVKLSDHNPQVRSLTLGRSDVVRWKSKDGLEVEGVLVYPIGYTAGRRYPTVAFIHGGPAGVWNQGFPAGWGNFAHVWASNGWVSFFPNPRGSVAYGEKFLLANVRDWGKGDYDDIQTGLDTLVARGIADPDKLAQSGWSYGGYMTAWTVTQTTRFKAAMVGAGLTNMYSMYSTNDLQRVLEGYFGGEPWNEEEAYKRASAMTYIKQAKTPTLILHGQADLRVPVGQAQELYMGLKKNNVPVELVFYPREPHGLQEPRHQLDKMRREYDWFARHVLGVGGPTRTVQE